MKRAALTFAFLLLALAINACEAPAAQVWHRAGASTFGGPCEPRESIGYRGDYLPTHPYSFAELSVNPGALDFSALGGLPYGTRLRVLNLHTHRRLNIIKRDIGAGGGTILGAPRRLDLYWPVTRYLDPAAGCARWTGVIYWRLLP